MSQLQQNPVRFQSQGKPRHFSWRGNKDAPDHLITMQHHTHSHAHMPPLLPNLCPQPHVNSHAHSMDKAARTCWTPSCPAGSPPCLAPELQDPSGRPPLWGCPISQRPLRQCTFRQRGARQSLRGRFIICTPPGPGLALRRPRQQT